MWLRVCEGQEQTEQEDGSRSGAGRVWGLTTGRTRGLLGAGNDLCLDLGAGFMGVLS